MISLKCYIWHPINIHFKFGRCKDQSQHFFFYLSIVFFTVGENSRCKCASLLQMNQPVAFASRILTDSEKDYAQIEKEMLALVFAATKFEMYIYGMPDVTFQTDHK